MNDTIEAFWQARQRGEYFPAAYYGKLSIDDAYRVQLGLIERRIAGNERQIGWKVGLTAPAIQAQFGFHEPVFGCVLETRPSGFAFGAGELISPGFENELCMRLRADLSGDVSLDQARAAIDAVYPALEIIETRGPFTEQIALALADNAQQKTCNPGRPASAAGRPGRYPGDSFDKRRYRRDRHWRRGAGQPAELCRVAGGKTRRLRQVAACGGYRNDRIVHPAVPDRAG